MRLLDIRTIRSALAVVSLLACQTATDAPATLTLAVIDGNDQSAIANHAVPAPLLVRVVDNRGRARSGVAVVWHVEAGGGSLSGTTTSTDPFGIAQAQWTLGRLPGRQSVKVHIADAEEVSVSFDAIANPAPVVIALDPAVSSATLMANPQLADTNAVDLVVLAIWGVTPTDVFAVGSSCSGPIGLRLMGNSWSGAPSSCASQAPIRGGISVTGRSSTDVYQLVREALPPAIGSVIMHFDGSQWTPSFTRRCSFCAQLNALWADSAVNVYAVGDSGTILKSSGGEWMAQASATVQPLRAVWGPSPRRIFAVGSAGVAVASNDNQWAMQSTGTGADLTAVHGTSVNDVFAVGSGGTIVHFDGSSWRVQTSGTTRYLYGVWARSPTDVFAVGDNGTVVHYDGVKWTLQASTPLLDFRAVWASTTSVLAAGIPR